MSASTEVTRSADLVALLRPAQWSKNAFVLAPLVFSQQLVDPQRLGAALWAFVVFCLASSSAYVLNDILDRERDGRHPLKSVRPLAAGRLGWRVAAWLSIGLGAMAVAAGAALGGSFLAVLGAFLLLQVFYSLLLKDVVVVDALAIATGFLLRAAAGVVAVEARMSAWLFLCTFLLALFLAFAKRRHEIAVLGAEATEHRGVLGRYTVGLLDQAITVMATTTVIAYIVYCMWPAVAEKLGTDHMYATVPFVVFGVFRYLFLVYGRAEGGNPASVLLADVPLQMGVASWLTVVLFLLYW